MKPKTGYESGTSPTVKVSENGALIQTGRGLEDTKRRIMEAFERIRQHPLTQPLRPPQQPQVVYTEQHEAHFHARAKKLTLVALSSARIGKTLRGDAVEIVVPTKSADELIAEAMRRRNYE